ncbi:hypothetical protein AVEN_46671-1 [Araneus ventricosus]|uniref:Uncharacterized protein n=1 Tax=Araneus ventricosus TaxID=182803 RepID=A0A4Y2UE11_ARAVE|nr:hypothetical protein AVEN_46671-1 [Araneus ventricosus]
MSQIDSELMSSQLKKSPSLKSGDRCDQGIASTRLAIYTDSSLRCASSFPASAFDVTPDASLISSRLVLQSRAMYRKGHELASSSQIGDKPLDGAARPTNHLFMTSNTCNNLLSMHRSFCCTSGSQTLATRTTYASHLQSRQDAVDREQRWHMYSLIVQSFPTCGRRTARSMQRTS